MSSALEHFFVDSWKAITGLSTAPQKVEKMTFDINQVKKTKKILPPRVVVHGKHKVGKSSFAAGAPNCVFLDIEDGLNHIDAESFGLIKSWDDLLGWMRAIYEGEKKWDTLALDSGDWAERLARRKVCEDHQVPGIEAVGYGKGYTYAAEYYAKLLNGLDMIRRKHSMAIIILCHSEIRHFDDPLADSYDRYQIKLHKHISPLIQEWADAIGYAQVEAVTTVEDQGGFKGERTRAVSTGRRVLQLDNNAAYDAGNRYGLPAQIDLSWQAFQAAFNAAVAVEEK